MIEAYVASTQTATNLVIAGMEAAKITTNYARQNAKEAARITSNTARTFSPTAKETVQVEGERGGEGINAGGSSTFGDGAGAGSAPGSFESRGAATTTTTITYTSEGAIAATSPSGTNASGTTTTNTNEQPTADATTGSAEKSRKK